MGQGRGRGAQGLSAGRLGAWWGRGGCSPGLVNLARAEVRLHLPPKLAGLGCIHSWCEAVPHTLCSAGKPPLAPLGPGQVWPAALADWGSDMSTTLVTEHSSSTDLVAKHRTGCAPAFPPAPCLPLVELARTTAGHQGRVSGGPKGPLASPKPLAPPAPAKHGQTLAVPSPPPSHSPGPCS